jgi:chaperonin GroEL
MSLKKGIERAVEQVSEQLLGMAKDVETKEQIASTASISAADTQIGEMIAEAMDKVGKEGVITVEESNTFGLELELTEGMRFDKGYISPYFVTDPERMEAVLDDPYVLVVNSKISAVKDLLPLLEKVMQSASRWRSSPRTSRARRSRRSVVNKIRGTFRSVAVKAPGFGDRRKAMLQDIAILTGGQVISEEVGLKLESAGLDLLGRARKVVVTKDETTIVEGAGDADQIAGRVNQIRNEIEKSDSDYDREKLQERPREARGRRGGHQGRRGDRGRAQGAQAPHRGRGAQRQGRGRGGHRRRWRRRAAPGRQVAFEKIDLEGDELTGALIVKTALEAPLKQIAINAGLEGGVVAEKVRGLEAGSRPQRRDRRVRRPDQGRDHRPRQGHALGAAERRVDRRPLPHHRGRDRRQAGEEPGRWRGRRHARRRRHGLLSRRAQQSTHHAGPAVRTPEGRLPTREPPLGTCWVSPALPPCPGCPHAPAGVAPVGCRRRHPAHGGSGPAGR